MKSAARREFWSCFERLPENVQAVARQAFELWQRNPRHPSLQFKKLHAKESIYSVRIGENWRALGLLREDTVYWFWIGSHADYDKEIRRY